jgi:hypothetical protein
MRSLAFVARLRRESRPLDLHRQRRLPLWNAARHSGRRVSVRVSEDVRTACAVGLGRGAIVLPRSLAVALDDDALDQIVMHEHAHLQRRDDLWRLLQALVECVAGLHPAVRIAARQIDLEREAACDDRVVIRTGEAGRYASCLAEAAALASSARPHYEPSLLPGAVRGSSALCTRVCRLLDARRRHGGHAAPAATVAGVLALSGVVLAASQIEPLVAFEARRAFEHVPTVQMVISVPGALDGTARPTRVARDRIAATSTPMTRGPATVPAPGVRPSQSPSVEATPVPAPSGDAGGSPLASRAIVTTSAAPALPAGTLPPVVSTDGPPWSAAADGGASIGLAARKGGVAVGVGAKRASTAVAGFFARTGRAVGSSF